MRDEKEMFVIEQTIPPAHAADSASNVLAEWNAIYDAYNEVACLMLGSMTPELHRQFENYSPYEMLQELKSMFKKQAGVERQIRRIHQGRYGVSVPAITKDHKGIKLNTPYPEDQYAVLEIWNEYNILEDIKRGPYSKKPPNTPYPILGYALNTAYPLPSNTAYQVLSNTTYLFKLINTVYPLPLDMAYRSFGTCMTRSSTNKQFTPYKEPEREFRSSRRHFKTLSLNELRSPAFNLFSDQEYLEEEEAEAIEETMEQYMSKTRTDYGSGVTRPKIDNKDQFELKGQFLKELQENTLSGSNNKDANEHIKKVLEIVDLFHVPNITVDQLMLRVFLISLTGAAIG
ncbi:hypothetical protein Tco_1144637 [Tanacetum coccineum]